MTDYWFGGVCVYARTRVDSPGPELSACNGFSSCRSGWECNTRGCSVCLGEDSGEKDRHNERRVYLWHNTNELNCGNWFHKCTHDCFLLFFYLCLFFSFYFETRLYKIQVFHVIFVVVYFCFDVIFKCTSFEIPLNLSLYQSRHGH